MSENVCTVTLRFHTDRSEDRAALAFLRGAGKSEYKSYTKAVVAAVNDHFFRRERLAADPYLETREKEDAFLRRIEETIERALKGNPLASLGALASLLQNTQQAPVPPSAEASKDEDDEQMKLAMDFIDAL